MADTAFEPDWFSRPGDTMLSLMEQREISGEQLAKSLGLNHDKVRGLIAGTVEIDANLAERISQILGGTPKFWLSRQAKYAGALSRAANAVPKETGADWVKQFPLKDMAEFGWIHRPTNRDELLKRYLAYFGVRNPKEWDERYADFSKQAAFRTSPTYTSKIGALSAWLRQAEIEASQVSTRPWNRSALLQRLNDVRVLTKTRNLAYFLPRMRSICAEAGVAVVFVRAPSGCRASGATRFVSADKAMVVLSFRHLSDDHFWFTFFHELGHLLLHSSALTFIDGEAAVSNEMETEANNFAANVLIPSDRRDEMMDIRPRMQNIIRFALSIGISPGIVVGQLQHRGAINRNQMNHLKRHFRWDDISSAIP